MFELILFNQPLSEWNVSNDGYEFYVFTSGKDLTSL